MLKRNAKKLFNNKNKKSKTIEPQQNQPKEIVLKNLEGNKKKSKEVKKKLIFFRIKKLMTQMRSQKPWIVFLQVYSTGRTTENTLIKCLRILPKASLRKK